MTSTAPPPPPLPFPPGSVPPPPPPVVSPPAKSGWKADDRPPNAPFEERSRWGLGDAFISFAIFVVTSMLLVSISVFIGVDPLAGLWLPVLVALPQLAQGLYVAAVGREQGAGIDRDFGFRFRWIDLLLALLLFVGSLLAAGATAVAMEALGFETPNASVAELVNDATDDDAEVITPGAPADDAEATTPDSSGSGSGSTTDDDSGDGGDLGAGIILVAIFAATAVPIIEELVYRGLWWSALLKRGVSERWTLVITSLAFAAAHFEPGRFVVLFVLGMGLGLGRMLTGRLGASILTHAFINGVAMIALLVAIDQGIEI